MKKQSKSKCVTKAKSEKCSIEKKDMKKAPKKLTQVEKAYTKSQIAAFMSSFAELKKDQAQKALSAITELLTLHLQKRGPGEFTMPGIAKFRVVRKPAVKARQGVNPFTGKPMTFAAKPARNVVKIRPLKKLKEIVA